MPGLLVTDQQFASGLDEEKRAVVDAVEAMLDRTLPDGISIKELRGESGKLPTIASRVSEGHMSAVAAAYTQSADSRSGSYRVSRGSGYIFMVDAGVIGDTVIQDEEYNGGILFMRSVSDLNETL